MGECDGECDGDSVCTDSPEPCTCDCHTSPRKPSCLCREGVLKCCQCCDCLCHDADWEEYDRTRPEREAKEKADREQQEKDRFEKEGVQDWEKKVLEHIMMCPDQKEVSYRQFMWAMDRKFTESGVMFMERMKASPWGSQYIEDALKGIHRSIY